MRTGKIAVQVGHASVEAWLDAESAKRTDWYNEGQKKICLKIENLDALRRYQDLARSKRLNSVVIVDFGLTQIEPNTPTCIAIGPDYDEKIDEITKGLSLL